MSYNKKAGRKTTSGDNSLKQWEKPTLTDLNVRDTKINTPGTLNDSTTTSGSAS